MSIIHSQDGSVLMICVCMCVQAGKAPSSPDGCGGSNHSTAEILLTLWAGALQAE